MGKNKNNGKNFYHIGLTRKACINCKKSVLVNSDNKKPLCKGCLTC